MRNTVRGLVLIGTLCGAASVWAGPISSWYLTAGDEGTNWIVQGVTATSFAQAHPDEGGEYAIAVTNSVRTLGNGNCGGAGCGLGADYSLAFSYSGTDYTYPPVQAAFYD